MAVPNTSLSLTSFLVNSVDLHEQLQDLAIQGENTTPDARGIADRYPNRPVTKQKQTVNFTAHVFNTSTTQEATNLDITVWSLGGTAYLGQVKSGSVNITNSGPEVSGIAVAYEIPLGTFTDCTVTSGIMVITSAAFTNTILSGTATSFKIIAIITFAGKEVSIPGVLHISRHDIKRGDTQMENVTLELSGTPTTPGDTTSLVYLALVGAAIVPFDTNTGANEYATGTGQTALISKLDMKFEDKELITQSVTLEVQGGMTVTPGS